MNWRILMKLIEIKVPYFNIIFKDKTGNILEEKGFLPTRPTKQDAKTLLESKGFEVEKVLDTSKETQVIEVPTEVLSEYLTQD